MRCDMLSWLRAMNVFKILPSSNLGRHNVKVQNALALECQKPEMPNNKMSKM